MASESIIGMERLLAKMGQLSGGQMEAVVTQGIKNIAAGCAATAKLLAPVDSGELRYGIHFEVETDSNGVTGTVFTNSDHAAFVEFGTGPIGAASGGDGSAVAVSYSTGPFAHKSKSGRIYYTNFWVYRGSDGRFHASRGMKPQPFLYPAAQVAKKTALPQMRSAFRKITGSQRGGA